MNVCCQCREEPLCFKEGICLEYRRLVDAVDASTSVTPVSNCPACKTSYLEPVEECDWGCGAVVVSGVPTVDGAQP